MQGPILSSALTSCKPHLNSRAAKYSADCSTADRAPHASVRTRTRGSVRLTTTHQHEQQNQAASGTRLGAEGQLVQRAQHERAGLGRLAALQQQGDLRAPEEVCCQQLGAVWQPAPCVGHVLHSKLQTALNAKATGTEH